MTGAEAQGQVEVSVVMRLRARADRAEASLEQGIAAGVVADGTYPPSRVERVKAAIRLDREAADLIEELQVAYERFMGRL